MEIRLREFRREDFPTLWGIDQNCFVPGIAYSQRELATYIRLPKAFTLVAETAWDGNTNGHSARIVGFLVADIGQRGNGHLITIDVLPEARKAGVGSKLLQEAERRLREADCRSIVLEAAVDNAPALAFYKRHGYFMVRAVPHYYSNGVDALVLHKDLLSQAQAV